MIIKQMAVPDRAAEAEIRRIELECRLYDGLQGRVFLDTSLNFNQQISCVYIGYEGSRPVGFVVLFIPTPNQAELSGMTLPDYRGRGCFKELVARAVEELKRYGIRDVLFVCEQASESGRVVIEGTGAKNEFTEYLLTYSHACDACVAQTDPRCSLIVAGESDLETLTDMDMAVFGTGQDRQNVMNLIRGSLSSPGRVQYILMYGGSPAGMAATYLEGDVVTIYGLGILPQIRGKGLGRQLLYLLLQRLIPGGASIKLEVDSGNATAFRLYTTSGFVQECAIAYYRKKY